MKIILTGCPGVGKTTVVRKVISLLGDFVIGFWTEEIRSKESNERHGFKVVTTDGESVVLASKFFDSPYRVGSYGVNLQNFEALVLPLLLRAKEEREKVIVIDEIGKMELFSKGFIDLVSEILFSDNYRVIATIPIRDVHPLVKKIRRTCRQLFEVSKENRDGIVKNIFDLVLKARID